VLLPQGRRFNRPGGRPIGGPGHHRPDGAQSPGDRVERFLVRRVKAAAEPVRQAIPAWVRAYRDAVREAYEAVEPIEGYRRPRGR
jgi:hypothetical protein